MPHSIVESLFFVHDPDNRKINARGGTAVPGLSQQKHKVVLYWEKSLIGGRSSDNASGKREFRGFDVKKAATS